MTRSLAPFAIALLLLLYLAGTTEVDTFHFAVHAHDKARLHTAKNEKDSCHRSVYHQDKAEGCAHPTHISELKKCPLCHVPSHADVFFLTPVIIQKTASSLVHYDGMAASITLGKASFRPSRAPPLIESIT